MKANNIFVTYEYLKAKADRSINAGFQKQKWITFCETLMDQGYKIKLYEARATFSKYVTVVGWDKEFKVRFSNHKPIYHRELQGDCDFFVGVTHTGYRTTDDALIAVKEYFRGNHEQGKQKQTYQEYCSPDISLCRSRPEQISFAGI